MKFLSTSETMKNSKMHLDIFGIQRVKNLFYESFFLIHIFFFKGPRLPWVIGGLRPTLPKAVTQLKYLQLLHIVYEYFSLDKF